MDGLQGARTSLSRIDECLGKLREIAGNAAAALDEKLLKSFTAAMDDDLNVAAAWGAIFDWVRDMNRRMAEKSLEANSAASALAAWNKIDSVLAIGVAPEAEAPSDIVALLEGRQAARKAKDFKRSDAIRDELKANGWAIEDTPKGPKLKKL
jgi:cysteinyl-tRNA synthetase